MALGLFLIGFIPFVGWIGSIGLAITIGMMGNELAWKHRRWDDIEQFKTVQRLWWVSPLRICLYAIVISLGLGVIGVIGVIIGSNSH